MGLDATSPLTGSCSVRVGVSLWEGVGFRIAPLPSPTRAENSIITRCHTSMQREQESLSLVALCDLRSSRGAELHS